MMSPLEIKRLKLELVRVNAAKADLEFRIEEALDLIAKLRENISAQEGHEVGLKTRIAEAEAAMPSSSKG